jgi:putative transposase
VFPLATVQSCVIHLIRGTFRYASKRHWEALAKDLRPIYTVPTVEAAWAAFEALEENWGARYPAIPKLWRASWEVFTPFLAYDVEIRRVLCSTNAIESLNARYRRAVTAKGLDPTAGRMPCELRDIAPWRMPGRRHRRGRFVGSG